MNVTNLIKDAIYEGMRTPKTIRQHILSQNNDPIGSERRLALRRELTDKHLRQHLHRMVREAEVTRTVVTKERGVNGNLKGKVAEYTLN